MNNYLPVMLLKGFVILPKQEVKLEVNNEISEKVIDLSIKHHNGEFLVVSPSNILEETPQINDLPLIGVIGKIKSKIDLPNGNVRVIIDGIDRVKINSYNNFIDDRDILMSSVSKIDYPEEDIVSKTALKRKIIDLLKKYITSNPTLSNSILNNLKEIEDLNELTDIVVSFIPFPIDKKIEYMEEISSINRANSLIYDLALELEILKIDEKIDEALQEDLEKNQRNFILHTKLDEIKKELGEDNQHENDVALYLEKINELKASDKTKDKLLQELKKFDYINDASPESSIIRSYLDTVLSLPWGIYNDDDLDLVSVRSSLDNNHYGLDKMKDRVIEYLAVKKRNPKINSPIICFVGPPGVGKTSLAIGIANALEKDYYKISVGGLNDPAELLGHRRTYLGSNPGKIIQALKKCNVSNPVIIIDEVDKMGKDFRGDPAAALLEILDPSQNNMFTDNYIEEPFDLSKVMFILTANDLSGIPEALLDRLEIMEMNSYTDIEKLNIAKKYIIPKVFDEHLITNKEIKIGDSIINYIISKYTKEAGVRELYRCITTVVRKLVTQNETGKNKFPITLKTNDISNILGKVKYEDLELNKTLKPGLVNGMAYTSHGGIIMPLESCLYEGKGNVITSGMLGKSMDESIKVAISYIKSNKDYFKVNDYYFNTKDIHLHALEGAIPKDGPSAGVTITTSILSLILNVNIPKDVAMTGEISLRGDVLEIGGLKEKLLGAYNAKIKKVFIPSSNLKDIDEIPKEILKKLEIIPVSKYSEIFQKLFN